MSPAGQCHESAPLPTRGGAAALAHWQPVLRRNSQALLLLSSECRFLELNVEYEWSVFLFAGFHCTRPCSLVSDNALLSGWFWCCCQGLWWRVRPRSRSLSISTCVCIFVPVWLHFPHCIFLCWWDPHISNDVKHDHDFWFCSTLVSRQQWLSVNAQVFFHFNVTTFCSSLSIRISSHSVAASLTFLYYSVDCGVYFLSNCPLALPLISSFPYLFISGAVLGRGCTSAWYPNGSAGNRCVVLYSSVRMKRHLSLGTRLFLFRTVWLHCLLCHRYGTAELCLHHVLVIAQLVGIGEKKVSLFSSLGCWWGKWNTHPVFQRS